jgi:hypothetical protein
LPVVEAALEGGAGRGSLTGPQILNRPEGLLRLRVNLADGDPQLGPRLQDPHAGALEREVFPVRALDEAIQDRIVEGPPPSRYVADSV